MRGLALLVLLGLAAWTGAEIHRLAQGEAPLPRWDEAKYGLDAARVADALRRDEPVRLLATLHGMSVWPPLVPVANGALMLVRGPDVRGPRLLAALCLVLTLPALGVAAHGIDRTLGSGAALLAVATLAPGVLPLVLGSLGMLETAGALAVVAALALRVRALRRGGAGRWLRAWWATTALFLVKANYGVLWAAPVVLDELRIAAGSWRSAGAAVLRSVRRIRWRSPWTWAVAAALAASAGILAVGGVDTEVAGARIRAGSPGGPLVVLWFLLLLRWGLRPRRSWRRFRTWRSGLPVRWRTAVDATVLPLAVWWTIPPHLKDLVAFLDNRSSGVPLLDRRTLLYPWETLRTGYSPAAVVLGVLGVAAAAVWIRGSDRGRRTLGLALLVGLAAVWIHPYQQPRFLFTVVPLLVLGGALGLLGALRRILGSETGAMALGLVAALGLAAHSRARLPEIREAAETSRRAWTVPADHRAVLEALHAAGRGDGRVLVLGLWDGLSPALVEWSVLEAAWERARPRIELEAWGRTAGQRREGAVRRRLREEPPVDALVVLDRLGEASGSGAYAEETAWAEPFRAAELPGWRLASRRPVAGTGYLLTSWRRAPVEGAAPRDAAP